jgi:hypothetical protein
MFPVSPVTLGQRQYLRVSLAVRSPRRRSKGARGGAVLQLTARTGAYCTGDCMVELGRSCRWLSSSVTQPCYTEASDTAAKWLIDKGLRRGGRASRRLRIDFQGTSDY